MESDTNHYQPCPVKKKFSHTGSSIYSYFQWARMNIPTGWSWRAYVQKVRAHLYFALFAKWLLKMGHFSPPTTTGLKPWTQNTSTGCQITIDIDRQTLARRSVCYTKSLMEDRHFSNELVTFVQGGQGVIRINPQHVPSRRISKRRRIGTRGSGISTCCSWSHISCQGEQYRAD